MAFNRQDERRKSKLLKVEEKWKIIFNQKSRAPVYSPQQYSEHLQKYTESGEGSDVRDVRPVDYLLRKLKVDMQMSFISFVEEFVRDTNQGLVLLLKLLKITQKATGNVSNKKSTAHETKRLLTEEHDCLLCIKYSLRLETVVRCLLDESYGLETVASSLMSAYTKSRIVALEVMNVMLTEQKGFIRNLECFTYFRLKNGEPVRFRFLISMLMSNRPQNLSFQICGMKFLNALLSATPDTNTRVYLQNEFRLAGLDLDVLRQIVNSNSSLGYKELNRELDDFCRNNLDVDALIESRSELEFSYTTLQRQLNRSRDADFLPFDGLSLKTTDEAQNKVKSSTNIPDPPPLPPCNECAQNVCKTEFPFFHWKPLDNITNTIFQTLDASRVLGDDVVERLNQTFRLRTNPERKPKTHLFKKGTKNTSKVAFLDCGRSKNVVIAMRRIGKSASVIKRAIQELDTDLLSHDHADLLLRFIPTDTERRMVLSLTCDYEDLAEAEQLVVQFVSIDDLEERLKLLVFMGQFDDKIIMIKPVIDAVTHSSISLWNCLKIHKVFEIILFLGNHLSSNKCGVASGFRLTCLSSLSDMKSRDKSLTLMDFLVGVVMEHFPGIRDWHTELDLPLIDKSSYSVMSAEIAELKDGVTNIHRMLSMTRQSNKLATFYVAATSAIDDITTTYHDMEMHYQAVCSMYGEDHQTTNPSDFFGYFRQFAVAYKTADDKVSSSHDYEPSNSDKILFTDDETSECNKQTLNQDVITPGALGQTLNQDVITPGTLGQNANQNKTEYYNDDYRSYQASSETPSWKENMSDKTNSPHRNLALQNTESVLRQDNSFNVVEIECEPDYSVDLYMGSDLNLDEDDFDQQRNLEVNVLDPHSLMASEKSKVENWIIRNNKALMRKKGQLHNCDISCRERNLQYRTCRNDSVPLQIELMETNNQHDVDSSDSAFGGSDGRILRSDGSRSYFGFVNSNEYLRTSNPRTIKSPDEPTPDYPVCNASGSVRSSSSYNSELSRILNDFEGNLYKYDTSSPVHTHRKFYTLRSIIYL